jgi:hypothetical protein
LAVADHGREAPLEGGEVFVGAQAEDIGHLFEGKRGAVVSEGLQDEFPTRDRVGVFLCFALLVGV